MLIRSIYLSILFICAPYVSMYAQNKSYTLKSPNQKIQSTIYVGGDSLFFSISNNNVLFIDAAKIALQLDNKTLGEHAKVLKKETSSQHETLEVPVPIKNKTLDVSYNSLTLNFKGNYSIEFKAFDNGFAYRFITSFSDSINIKNEIANYHFSDNYTAYISKTERQFSNYEHPYGKVWLQDWDQKDLSVSPIFIDAYNTKVLISDADVYDYPTLMLEGHSGNQINGWFAKTPAKTAAYSDRRLRVVEESDYIAKTVGKRTFPWRVFTISDDDKGIANSDLTYILSRQSEYKNVDWIRPGQTSWEWWHASNIRGVDFRSGYNTETYKYYIDFASKYKVEYIIMDEGWSNSVLDITQANPDIDLPELIRYANSKGVKIILWASWLAVEQTPTFFKQVKDLGAAGLKIDFMDRSDQWMVNYYERTAKKAFENELLVDFHGSYSPKGLRRAYPNVISYEGLTGMEQNKGGGHDLPNNRVILPFTRNAVGPMDYTPGSMKSVHTRNWHANWYNPMSIGTRAHQLALYVVFESALQMLADNPSDYLKEHESTEFITSVPTTWDKTIVTNAKIGNYYAVAKKKDDQWFIGGITNDTSRDLIIDFSFLEKGKTYTLQLFKDGINADKNALDFKKEKIKIDSNTKLKIHLVYDGGFAGVINIK